MNIWKKIFCCVFLVALLSGAAILQGQENRECPLCSSRRYHAPCLIDLETGKLVELALYAPHGTKTGELAAEQPETDTFSLIRLGNATGFRQTGSRIIQIDIPCAETAAAPALCKDCQRLAAGYGGRYILADLYGKESKQLLPIIDGSETELRCYRISVTTDETKNRTRITVQAIRNIKNTAYFDNTQYYKACQILQYASLQKATACSEKQAVASLVQYIPC